METKPVKILFIDDDEDDFILIQSMLREIPSQTFTVEWEPVFNKASEKIRDGNHDLFFVDYRLGDRTGIDVLSDLKAMGQDKPVIMLTGKGDRNIALEVMKLGAADYVEKGKLDALILERSVRYALERHRNLDALRTSEKKFRTIFEKSRDVIYITNKEGYFIDFNDSATRLFGYSREELFKLNVTQLYANIEDRKKFEEEIKRSGEVTDFEVNLLSKKGEKLFCLLTTTLQPGANGGADLYQGIIHDITKRKKAEQELRNIEKHAVSGRIARTIAHEIRNPLTNINLSLEQLRLEVTDDENITMFLDIISRNSDRINALISELLNSAKPTQLQSSSSSLNDILDETLTLASDRIKLKEIKVVKNYSDNLDNIMLDGEKIKIAFLNIIINAVEAMEPGKGVLTLTTEKRENKVCVLISDNGSGIEPENLNQLFEPFFSGKPKGMGLGLTTTQNIILNHKGRIEVESEKNKGTTFVISFNLN